MSLRKDLLLLRVLHGLPGKEIAEGISFDNLPDLEGPFLRDDSLCWNCDGQKMVFPGLPGKPMIPDTSRILTCPTCGGTGKRPPQMRLFE